MLKDLKILILVFFALFSIFAIFYLIKNISTQSLLAQISDFINREKNFENELLNLKGKISNLEEKVDAITEEISNLKNLKVVVGELETKSQKVEEENQKEKEDVKICQNFDGKPKLEIIFNEICWMGDEDSPANEWIELKNVSQREIDLAGWQILNKNQRIKIVFTNTKILPGEFLVLKRGDDFTGAIKNSDEALFLFDENCNLQDKVEATSTWPAGDNETKRTAERKEDLSWQTSQDSGGTPGKENSKGLIFVEEKEEKEKIEPKITLNYPSEIFSQKEFEVSLSVSDLNYDTYDVKISILKISEESEQKRTISEISLTGEEWQDSYRYLTNVFTGNSFSGKFKIRINQDFSGQAEIIAKIRQSLNKKIVVEFSKKIYVEKFQEIIQIPPEQQFSTETSTQPSEEVQPQINLSYDLALPVNKELLVLLSASNLKESTYDVKISIEVNDQILSEIFDERQNKWQSSYYYLKEVFSGNSFSGNFKLRIKSSENNFRGTANLIAKIRETGKTTTYLEFRGGINILEPE